MMGMFVIVLINDYGNHFTVYAFIKRVVHLKFLFLDHTSIKLETNNTELILKMVQHQQLAVLWVHW